MRFIADATLSTSAFNIPLWYSSSFSFFRPAASSCLLSYAIFPRNVKKWLSRIPRCGDARKRSFQSHFKRAPIVELFRSQSHVWLCLASSSVFIEGKKWLLSTEEVLDVALLLLYGSDWIGLHTHLQIEWILEEKNDFFSILRSLYYYSIVAYLLADAITTAIQPL